MIEFYLFLMGMTVYVKPPMPLLHTQNIVAVTTAYSSKDSCHYPNCIMANGKRAYVGAAACPRKVALGTKIRIDGKNYMCADRTAKWVEEKFGDTYDIFMGYSEESYREAIKYGRQVNNVTHL